MSRNQIRGNTQIISETITDSEISSSAGISADKLADGLTNAIPTLTQESNWDTAYGWGDHAAAGYLTVDADVFIDGEVPSGTPNDVLVDFVLDFTPIAGSTHVYVNGIRQRPTTDYSGATDTITFTTAPSTGDSILVDYRK
jgi:hypothetical protein